MHPLTPLSAMPMHPDAAYFAILLRLTLDHFTFSNAKWFYLSRGQYRHPILMVNEWMFL